MKLVPTFGPRTANYPLIYVADAIGELAPFPFCIKTKEGFECYSTADNAARRQGESTLHASLPQGCVEYPGR